MTIKVGSLDLLASRFASRVLRYNVARAVAPRMVAADAVPDVSESSAASIIPAPPPPRHELILYDFEGSPWCRLVREYATILDLTLSVRPCPRETLLYGEGAFSAKSKFRPEAMEWYKSNNKSKKNSRYRRRKASTNTNHRFSRDDDEEGMVTDEKHDGGHHSEEADNDDNLTFPLLVDLTNAKNRHGKINVDGNDDDTNDDDNDDDGIVVLTQSYDILCHLWKHYGASVIPSSPSKNSTNKNVGVDSAATTTTTTTTGGGNPRFEFRRRPDQIVNSFAAPFPIRFLSLAGPSYLRPWPRCGVMRFPSSFSSSTTTTGMPSSFFPRIEQIQRQPPLSTAKITITLHQAEGCPESRLVREVLCSLEIPYRSVPVADGSFNRLPTTSVQSNCTYALDTTSHTTVNETKDGNVHDSVNINIDDNGRDGAGEGNAVRISVLEVSILDDAAAAATTTGNISPSGSNKTAVVYRIGARECVDYLRDTFYHPHSSASSSSTCSSRNNSGADGNANTNPDADPTWLDPFPEENFGRQSTGDGSNSVAIGAYTAFLKGSRAFVPERAME